MVGCSKAAGRGRGSKTEKTRAQKDAHNARCRESRQKLRRRREELEKTETEHIEMIHKYNQTRAENQTIKRELQEKNSQIQQMENEIHQLKTALHKQAADEERMRLIPGGWRVNGQNFSSFDESVTWFASQTYEQFGSDNTSSLSASSAGTSFLANYDLPPSLFGAPNNNLIADHNSAAGISAASAPDPSSVPNHGLFVFDVPENDGFLTEAADSSTDRDLHLPPLFGAMDDLIGLHPPADYRPGFPPSTKAL